MKISSPWVSYWHKIEAMFGSDPDIKLDWDGQKNVITFRVNGVDKAEALEKLLPKQKLFGNIPVNIKIVPANTEKETCDIVRKAFEGNPLYKDTVVVRPGGTNNPFCYVIFDHDVVQYWDDNLGDPHGIVSTLAQDLAKELLEPQGGVYYCTDMW